MVNLRVRVSDALAAKIKAEARRRGITVSQAICEALEEWLESPALKKRPSCHDLSADLVGSLEGPGDLSTNPDRMKGYGR
jgi:hypothetical protein